MSKGTVVDTEAIRAAYQEVRHDGSDTNWAVFKYEGKSLGHDSSGMDYNEFKGKFTDDERGFGYVRCTMGDELSKRCKFALITWVGANISPLPRAKMSTDKALIKGIITSIAAEIQPNDADELEEEHVKGILRKAGGANYGTGGADASSESNGTRRAEVPVKPAPVVDDSVEEAYPGEEGTGEYVEEDYKGAGDNPGADDNGVNPETAEYPPEQMEDDEQ